MPAVQWGPPGAVQCDDAQEPQRARHGWLQLSKQLEDAGGPREAMRDLPTLAASAPAQQAQRRGSWRRELPLRPCLGCLPGAGAAAGLLREARSAGIRCRAGCCRNASTQWGIEDHVGLALGGQVTGRALQLLT